MAVAFLGTVLARTPLAAQSFAPSAEPLSFRIALPTLSFRDSSGAVRQRNALRVPEAPVVSETRTGSHLVRNAGIIGATVGLLAGVAGASVLGAGDIGGGKDATSSAARMVSYLGASGAVAGWVVGTTASLPFHGHNEIGPHDVRNAGITGAAVGLMTGIAAGSLAGFKCTSCSSHTHPMRTITGFGLTGALVGWLVGQGIGLALPHQDAGTAP